MLISSRRFYIFFILLTLTIPYLCANGGSEKNLEEISYTIEDAEALIGIDNNEALRILVEITRSNPEKMEEAQKLMNVIRQAKEEYNKIYSELLVALYDDEDYKTSLELIERLGKIDANPNENTQAAIREARISAELVYNIQAFREIMGQAAVLLDERKLLEAIEVYRTGFNLYRQTFDESDYGNLIKDPVYTALDNMESALSAFETGNPVLVRNAEEAIADIRVNNGINVNSSFITGRLDLVTGYRDTINASAELLRQQNITLSELREGFTEDFFLSFMEKIMSGRNTVDFREGLVTAIEYQWEDILDELLDASGEVLIEGSHDALRIFKDQQWEDSILAWGDVFQQGRLIQDYYSLIGNRLAEDNSVTTQEYKDYLESRYKRYNQSAKTAIAGGNFYIQLAQTGSNMKEYLNPERYGVDTLYLYKDLLAFENESLAALEMESAGARVELEEEGEPGEEFSGTFWDTLSEEITSMKNYVTNIRSDVVVAILDKSLIPLDTEIASLGTLVEENGALIDGVPDPADNKRLLRYPERARTSLLAGITDLEEAVENNDEYIRLFEEERDSITTSDKLDEYSIKGSENGDTLTDLRETIDELLNRSDEYILLADKNLREGDFRYNTAMQEFINQNFTQSVQELTRAQEHYSEALSYNEDIIDRIEVDNRIANFEQEVIQEQRRLVILEVRQLLNQGKDSYYQGEFDRSEERLVRAENTWFSVNIEENTEITYWRNLVRTALSVESGRRVAREDPLYAEMTQYLNLAFAHYEEARNFTAGNRQVDALNSIRRAREYLYLVLQPLPLNEDAAILQLRLTQLENPGEFRQIFSQKVNDAKAKMNTAPSDGYLELKNLEAIDPGFRGLSDAIYDFEIVLGIRQPPPDPAALAESETLYREALAIVEDNLKLQYPLALEELNRAIELNPNNEKAIILKDQIQLEAGEPRTFVLSSAAQARYQEAEQKFLDGVYFESYQIIQELMEDEKNASYAPLKDLERRVRLKIGL